MKNKTVKISGLIIVLLLTFSTNAEKLDVHDYIPTDKETFKEILSSDLPIKMIGWVDKNKQFVDGSPIEILYSANNQERMIIEGIISHGSNNTTYIDGVLYQQYTPGKTFQFKPDNHISMLGRAAFPQRDASDYPQDNNSMVGRFAVWNTVEKHLSADKKSQKIKNRSGNKEAVPLSIEIVTVDEYKYLGREYGNNLPPVKNEFLGRSHDSKFPLLYIDMKCGEDGKIIANIDPECLEENWKKKASVIETTVDSFDHNLSIRDNWHIIFENGDEWNGSIRTDNTSNLWFSFQEGLYRLHNGDSFKGDLHTSFVFSNRKWPQWTDAHNLEIQFADGLNIKSEVWNESLKVKDLLKEEERDQIYKQSATPIEYRENIIAAITDKENKKKQAELEKAEQEKRQLLETQGKYISKYGEKYGKLVAEKKVAQGMTKQMVKEFLPEEWYVITRSGNTEIWRYSDSKVEQSMYKSQKTMEISMMARMFGTSVSQLIRTSGTLGLSDIPLVIKFSGGKVTSITR